MLYLTLGAAFGATCLAVLALAYWWGEGERELARRLSVFAGETPVDLHREELSASFLERAVRPGLKNLSKGMGKLFSMEKRAEIEVLLRKAGHPGRLSPADFLALKGVALGLVILLTFPLFGKNPAATVLLGGGGAAMAWIIPDTWLRRLAKARQDEVNKSLPETLDLLTVCVEAGLGLDGALDRVAEKKEGVLAEELSRMLQEVQLGKPRREALRDLAARVGNQELTALVSALVQADRLGLSLGTVLRSQAERIRQKRRQEVEERAMQLPVKMLLPLITCIFPAIFIVMLGPAVLQIIKAFR